MRRPRDIGSVFTPEPLARHLVRAALDGRPEPRAVCDPAAGDGRLLGAVVDAVSTPPTLYAADIDDHAWCAGTIAGRPGVHFTVGDALGRGLDLWSDAHDGFDLVIGNPPFLSQLARATVRTPDQRRRAERLGVGGAADSATAFLVAACGMLAPGGRVAMIMPLSFLSSGDAEPARRRVLEQCRLAGIWVSAGNAFPDADVETCALFLDRVDVQGPVRRWSGRGWRRAADAEVGEGIASAATWSYLVSDLLSDVPNIEIEASHGRLGDIARATAGFRDQFYGLAPLAREVEPPAAGRDDGRLPLITSGAIDPGHIRWTETNARIAGRTLLRPAVDPRDLEPGSALARWVAARQVPKVLVATQTRVLEAAVDPTGEWIPSTPVVSVECNPDDLWRVLAVLLAPPVTMWARRHFAGAARSARAVKLSARQVLDVPLPPQGPAWRESARLFRDAHEIPAGGVPSGTVLTAGSLMCQAYGCDQEVWHWWSSQLPRRSSSTGLP